jgi:metal-sulfur cluster biosynthetic enzyme
MTDEPVSLAQLLRVEVDPDLVREALGAVIDPELGVSIVELGLVYDVSVDDGIARVLLTTTTPACPIGSYLEDEVRWAALAIDGVLDVEVMLTHEPPWSPERMTDLGRAQLGWI